MAKRPKPVPQMTTANSRPVSPSGTMKRAFDTLWRGVGRKASIARVAAMRTCTTPLATSRFIGSAAECAEDGYRFSCLGGTIFENTKKPLRDWYRVAHLMLSSKKGMSALQIQRMLGFGSYETAHSMCHKIRAGADRARNQNWRHRGNR